MITVSPISNRFIKKKIMKLLFMFTQPNKNNENKNKTKTKRKHYGQKN